MLYAILRIWQGEFRRRNEILPSAKPRSSSTTRMTSGSLAAMAATPAGSLPLDRVSPQFLDAVGVPVVRGRGLTEQDTGNFAAGCRGEPGAAGSTGPQRFEKTSRRGLIT
jgi:hypothetical protein